MRFSQAVSGTLIISELEELLADCACASGLTVFALDYKGSLFTKVSGLPFLSGGEDVDPSLLTTYKVWGAKAGIYSAMDGEPGVFFCPAGFFFGVIPIIVDEVCYGAVFIGPAVPEEIVFSDKVVLLEENPDHDEILKRSGKLRQKYETLRLRYAQGLKYSVEQMEGLVRLTGKSLSGILQKELVEKLVSEYERKLLAKEQEKDSEMLSGSVGSEGAVYEKLRHAFQRHVYRECVNIVHNRIFEIYDEESDEVERYRRLADFFLVLSKVSAEFHAPLSELILKDVESNSFISTLTKGRYYVVAMAEGYISKIFGEMDRTYQYQNGMERAINYIDSHIREDISLETAAHSADLNSDYFSKMFKKSMSVNFVTYLSARRMDIAGEMLLYTDMPVADIAEEVSYGAETGYFSKSFKKYFGVTPTEFRQISQKASNRGKRRKSVDNKDNLESLLRVPPQFKLRNRHLFI